MQATLGLLADYANVTREGKLNIMGIFDRIVVPSFPGRHPQMQLVLRMEAAFTERDRPHKVEVRFHQPEGSALFEISAELVVGGGDPGEAATANQILTLGNLPLPKEGVYFFAIVVDGDLKLQIPLKVQKAADPSQPNLLPGM